MIDLIEEAAIPMSTVGLLYALPNTQLTRRLEQRGASRQGIIWLPSRDSRIRAWPA